MISRLETTEITISQIQPTQQGYQIPNTTETTFHFIMVHMCIRLPAFVTS